MDKRITSAHTSRYNFVIKKSEKLILYFFLNLILFYLIIMRKVIE